MSVSVSFVVCSSRAWLFALIWSTTLSMFLLGDLVMKPFGDHEVTIRIGVDVDESEARFIISIVLELVSNDRSIWISEFGFCDGCQSFSCERELSLCDCRLFRFLLEC